MILPDTSAWVEYLRATGSPAHQRLRQLLADDAPLLTTEVVTMELLAGARDDVQLQRLRRLLARCDVTPPLGMSGYEAAAALYRTCRQAGITPRALTDCLISISAIRTDASLLLADRDFDLIAEHSSLKIASVT